MKFWNMGKDKDNSAEEPEMTALEKRLVEKAALEEDEDEAASGPKNLKEAQAQAVLWVMFPMKIIKWTLVGKSYTLGFQK